MTARAGWFPDPAGRPEHYRWWDGSAWTRFLTTDPTAAAPDPEVATLPTGEPDGSRNQARRQAAGPTPWQRAGDVVTAETSVVRGTTWPPGYQRPSRPQGARPGALKPAVFGTGAVALVAAIVLAIVLFGHPASEGLEPPPPVASSDALSPTPSPTPRPTVGGNRPRVTFDPLTRTFSMEGLEITLPAAPYTITRPDSTELGGPGGGVRADAVVHKDYDGVGSDWTATVEVDQVGSAMRGKSLQETADKIISTWATAAFAGRKARIENETKSTITKNEPRPVRIVTADFHYRVKGVKSSYDHVSLMVTEGPSGNYVAFVSSRPDDASPKIKKALEDSISTIHLV